MPAVSPTSAFKRTRLGVTWYAVKHTKLLIDGFNRVMLWVMGPMMRAWRRSVGDAPWLIFAVGSSALMFVPSGFHPVLVGFIAKNERKELEEERVRQCLQQGIDPSPYRTGRDHMYGAITVTQVSSPTQVDPSDVEEVGAVVRKRRIQRAVDYEHLEELDAQIEALRQKQAAAAEEEGDAVMQWIGDGIAAEKRERSTM